jgi:hypothetical protein
MQALIDSLNPLHIIYGVAGIVTLYYGLRAANQKLLDRLDLISEQARNDAAHLAAHESRTEARIKSLEDTRIKSLEDRSERHAIEAGRFEERLTGMYHALGRIESKIDKVIRE